MAESRLSIYHGHSSVIGTIEDVLDNIVNEFFFMHFCPGTMTTHAELINSDLQRGLDRRLRITTLITELNQLAIKVPNTTATLVVKY